MDDSVDTMIVAELSRDGRATLADLSAATLIGAGCKVCERPACPQRAFPPIGRPLVIDPNRSAATPYPSAALQ